MTSPVQVIGAKELNRYLRGSAAKIKDRKPAYRKISTYLTRSQSEKMSRSRGRYGKLKPVQRWTRIIAGKNANSRVLIPTGQLRRSFNTLSLTDKRLVFGPRGGAERQKALDMIYGRTGYIKVAPKFLRDKDDGTGLYVRIRDNDGNWYTKNADNGFVTVEPQEREFIFVSAKDRREIRNLLRQHVRRATR